MTETDPTPEEAAGRPDPLEVPELLDRADAGLPPQDRHHHGGVPDLDDDELARTVQRERVAAGLEDYAPDDVPPATDPLPDGSSEAADLAQRGLEDGAAVDLDDAG